MATNPKIETFSSEEPEAYFDDKERSAHIMVVEDNENNRDLLTRRLERQGHTVVTAENGLVALRKLGEHNVDIMLLDLMMPEMDGYQVLEHMKQDDELKNIPVVVITAINDMDTTVKCIELGAEDYLPKPFNPTLLKARINACLSKKWLRDREVQYRSFIEDTNRQLGERVRQQVKQITSTQMATIFAMSKLAESRDPETGAHLERMREYCKVLSEHMSKLDSHKDVIDRVFIDNIYAASPLHDIGKVGILDNVLLKAGALDDEEWVLMKQHPVIGAETLRAVDAQHPGNEFIKTGIAIAEFHHEKWDGSGYPHGLKGDGIPLEARILALGDVYDALTSKRCYKDAFTHEKSRDIILESNNKHFDPAVVEAFLGIEHEFVKIRSFYKDIEE
ncbi:MAG: response regulator [Gammaproteobacteria bacterium]|nr:response regulator [Gammaproteobacteria bacterium]